MFNIYSFIILSAILFALIIGIIADYFNLKNLRKPVPEEFGDSVDEDAFRKSQDYTIVNTKFSFIREVFSLLVLLTAWFSGAFNSLDILFRSYTLNPIVLGIAFIVAIMLVQSILGLPFTLYSTFIIEARFGFNKTTVRTFILDRLKGMILGVVLGIPVLAVVLYLFNYFGDMSWLYGWIFLMSITFIMQYFAPRFIMPLFNKFKALEEGELRSRIQSLATKLDFPLNEVFIIDGSKRSAKTNAFFTGFGKNKRIALYDTLILKHTTDEIIAILAHEIGHYKLRHIQTGMIISILHSGLLLYLLSVFISEPELFRAFYMENISVYAGLLLFGLLYSPLEEILSMLMNVISRKNEFAADEFAFRATGDADTLINSFRKLASDNLSNLNPHPFYVFMNYSHPPIVDRIRAIRRLEQDIKSTS
jgi:STE24 endopeptidase